MPLVKASPTISIIVLIVEMQSRYKYTISYQKAWHAKQKAISRLYGDWDNFYNELQSLLATMRQLAPNIVLELQTLNIPPITLDI